MRKRSATRDTVFAPRVRVAVTLLAAASACALTSADDVAEPRILAPTLGRPAFAQAEGQLAVTAYVAAAAEPVVFELVAADFPSHRHTLMAPEDAAAQLGTGQPLNLRLPAGVPHGTYDLVLRSGTTQLVAKHCVAVWQPTHRVRLVHLSNMNVGDPNAPDFDWQLVDEVNLVAPTLIVVTGDFLDATHPHHEAGWQRVTDYLTSFDAPAVVACGDHDDLELYSRHIAPSPVGDVVVGGLRGIVLFDVPRRPVTGDSEQVDWLERTLAVPGDDRPTFIVSHDESPNLLRVWQSRGVLPEMLNSTRVGVWFAGGHRDWDGTEYRKLLDAATPMVYVRTHQSSTATCAGAEGVSHYRVVDLDGGRVWLPGLDHAAAGGPPSIPVGLLHSVFDEPNDGTRTQVAFTAVNNHPFRLDGLGVRVLLKREGPSRPWCAGGELESAVGIGQCWDCRVRFDLPEKGALHAVAGTGPAPAEPQVDVLFDGDLQMPLTRRAAGDGVSYLAGTGALTLLHLRNRGAGPASVTPLIRLDGQTLAYTLLDEPGPLATAYRLRIAPGQTLTLQVDLTAARVRPGRRELQVYLKGTAAWRPFCYPLDVSIVQ